MESYPGGGNSMSDEKYPLLEIGKEEENLLFSTPLQEQARIGFLRGDFGRGAEFWTTWWDQSTELKGQEFRDELNDLVDTLREKGPLRNLFTMRRFCWDHPQAQMSPEAGSRYYAFRIDTNLHRYYLRLIPERDDYNFYIYCYRVDKLEKDISQPPFARHGKERNKKHRNRGER